MVSTEVSQKVRRKGEAVNMFFQCSKIQYLGRISGFCPRQDSREHRHSVLTVIALVESWRAVFSRNRRRTRS
jgi:hypothetical protein